MKRLLSLGIVALAMAACRDERSLGPGPRPEAAISDGAHGGNAHFYFRPPMVPDAPFSGTFNGRLSPTVEICVLDLSASPHKCADPQPTERGFPIVFTRTTGPGSETIRVNETDQHYIVNWHTDQFDLKSTEIYRIRVLGSARGQQEWGFADVELTDTPGKMKKKQTSTEQEEATIELVDGRTLPIVFRAEFGVYTGDCLDGDCIEQAVGADGGTVVTPSGFAGVDIPAGALDNDVTIIIDRIDTFERQCLPTHLRQFEGCYFYDTDPPLREVQNSGLDQFNVDVTVGICVDPENVIDDLLQLAKFDPERPGDGVVLLEGAAADFVQCENFNSGTEITSLFGRLRHYARAGWRGVQRHVGPWFSPPPLHAGDEGPGGLTGSFTDIGWVLPAVMSLQGGDGQSGAMNSPLATNLSVVVNSTHPTTAPLAGAAVTFSITGGGGGLRIPGSENTPTSTLTVLTDVDGIASATMVLGPVAGTQTATASAPADGSPVTFTATASDILIQCGPYAAGTFGGDFIDRGFYVPSFPGSSLQEVRLRFSSTVAGDYTVQLTAREGSFDGPVIGTATTAVTLSSSSGDFVFGTFSFGAVAVEPGSTVTFAIEQTAAPSTTLAFYGVPSLGDDACPVVQTNGTSPPLDTFRRQGVDIRILGVP